MTDIGGIVGFLRVEDEFSAAFDLAQGKLTQFSSAFLNAGRALTIVGAGFAGAVTAPIVGGLTQSVEAAISFESAFANVSKVLNPLPEEAAKWTAELRKMALEIPSTREELAKIASIGGQFGISKEGIIDFTRSVAMLDSAIDGISGEKAAAGLAQVSKITGVAEKDFLRLSDVLVDLGNKGSSTEAVILEFARRLSGAGTTIGLTAQEIFGIGAAMANLGINAEAGGSAFSRIMMDIDKAVARGGEKLDKFAAVVQMSSASFAQAFKDKPVAALDAFFSGLGTAEQRGLNLNLVLDDLGMNAIRVGDVTRRLANAQGEFTQQVEFATKAWDQNKATMEEFNTKAATTANQWIMLKNRISDIGVELGNVFIPVLKNMIDQAKPLIDWAKDLAVQFGKLPTPIQAFAFAMAAAAAAFPVLLIFLGQVAFAIGALTGNATRATAAMIAKTEADVANTIAATANAGAVELQATALNTFTFSASRAIIPGTAWTYTMETATVATTGAATSVGILEGALALLFSPITIITALIVGLAVAWANFKNDWTRAFDVLIPPLGLFRAGWDALMKAVEPHKQLFTDIGSILHSVFTITVNMVIDWVKDAIKWFEGLGTAISNFGAKLKTAFVADLKQAWGELQGFFDKLKEYTGLDIHEAIRQVKELADKAKALKDAGGEKLKEFKTDVHLMAGAMKEVADASNGVTAPVVGASAAFANLGRNIKVPANDLVFLGHEEELFGQKTAVAGAAVGDLSTKLREAQAMIAGLTDKQRANLNAGLEMHMNTKELVTEMAKLFPGIKLTAEAVDLYKDSLKDAVKNQKDATKEAKEYQKAMEDLAKAHASSIELARKSNQEFMKQNQVVAAMKNDAIAKAFLAEKKAQEDIDKMIREKTMGRVEFEIDQIERKTNEEIRQLDLTTAAGQRAAMMLSDKAFRQKMDIITEDELAQWVLFANLTTEANKRVQELRDQQIGDILGDLSDFFVNMSHLMGKQGGGFGSKIQEATERLAKLRSEGASAADIMDAERAVARAWGQEIFQSAGQIVIGLKAWHEAAMQTDKFGQKMGGDFGALSIVFNENAKTADRWAAGLTAALGIATGAMAIWNATSNARSRGGAAASGAMAGAQAGAMFGPWGIAVGAAAGFFVGLIRGKAEWAKAADEVGRDFGVKISDALAKEIEASAKTLFHGDRSTAIQFHLADIIKEDGGLDADNIEKYTSKLRDTFSFLERGQLNMAQATKVLDDNWAAFAEAGTSANGRLSAGLREIIKLVDEFGMHSQAVTEYLQGQAARSIQGWNAVIEASTTGFERYKKQVEDAEETVKDATKAQEEFSEKLNKTLTEKRNDLGDSLFKTMFEGSDKRIDEVKEALSSLGISFDKLKTVRPEQMFDMVNASLSKVEDQTERNRLGVALFGSTYLDLIRDIQKGDSDLADLEEKKKSALSILKDQMKERAEVAAREKQNLADLGTVAVGTFAAAVASGKTFAEALALAAPGLQNLGKAYEDLGIPIEDAGVKSLVLQANLLKNTPQLINGVQGLSDSFIGLSNMGLLTADTFAAMQRVGASMYTRLQGEVANMGGDTRDALLPMQDYLHNAAEQAEILGIPLDAVTQEMINQSQALGIWKEQGPDAMEQMTSATEHLAEVMERVVAQLERMPGLAQAAGSSLTSAFDGANTSVQGADSSLQGFEYGHSPGGLISIPGLADAALMKIQDLTQSAVFGFDDAYDYAKKFQGQLEGGATDLSPKMPQIVPDDYFADIIRNWMGGGKGGFVVPPMENRLFDPNRNVPMNDDVDRILANWQQNQAIMNEQNRQQEEMVRALHDLVSKMPADPSDDVHGYWERRGGDVNEAFNNERGDPEVVRQTETTIIAPIYLDRRQNPQEAADLVFSQLPRAVYGDRDGLRVAIRNAVSDID